LITAFVIAALPAALVIQAPGVSAEPVGVITEFPAPTGDIQGMAQGADGNFWFVQLGTSEVTRITPTGIVTEFATPTPSSQPTDITAGPDGNLWFTQQAAAANRIGRITPAGVITEFPLASTGSPTFITAGPDGNIWFTKANNNNIFRMSTDGVVTGTFPIPTAGSAPAGITAGPDGNIWFTEFFKNQIGRITPSGAITEFSIPTASTSPRDIAAGPDGNIWFTETANLVNRIGRITPSGAITEFPIPTANAGLDSITSGPDGNLWFTQGGGNRVARITPTGTVTEYPLPNPSSSPRAIAAGSDGALWFVENFGSRVGRITSGTSPADRKPVLAGSGQVGLPLACGADVWGTSSTVTVGWRRNAATIPGQTGLTYVPTDADLGSTISCVSTATLPGVIARLSATSNGINVVSQVTGPPGPPGAAGPAGQLAAVFAPGDKRVKAGKTLRVQFGVTSTTPLTAQLRGKKSATKSVQARAGTNTLRWKLPRSLKPGRYSLRLLFEGNVKAQTAVRITR
jgi:streptogramin lyase